MIIEPLAAHHPLSSFRCSNETLSRWLADKAMFNHQRGYTRTFAGLTTTGEVIGYYSLCAASLERKVFGRAEQGAPKAIPLMLLARWAVGMDFEGKGFGKILLEDALERCLRLSQETGIRAIIVNPIDERAKSIYEHFGFRMLIEDTMFLPISLLQD